MANEEKYENMTRDELYEIAKEKDIPGKSRMGKEELKQAVLEQEGSGSSRGSSKSESRHEPSAPGQGGGKGDAPAPKGSKPEEYKNIPGNQT